MEDANLFWNGTTTSTDGHTNETVNWNVLNDVVAFWNSCPLPDYWKTVDIGIATWIIGGVSIVVGMLYTFFGYRLFKTLMFLAGFVFGSVIICLVCMYDSPLPLYANIGVAVCCSVILGLAAALVQNIGLFITAFYSGILTHMATTAAMFIATHYTWPNMWVGIGVMIAHCCLYFFLSLYFKKGFTIFESSVIGGAILFAVADYLTGNFAIWKWIWGKNTVDKNHEFPSDCWKSYAIFVLWPFACLLGIFVQSCFTGKGIHHYHQYHGVSRKLSDNEQRFHPPNREERAEMNQNKYRYLYQVRTAQGDVISQNYVHALQGKGLPAGTLNTDSSTLQSDATNLTILKNNTMGGNTIDAANFESGNRNPRQFYFK